MFKVDNFMITRRSTVGTKTVQDKDIVQFVHPIPEDKTEDTYVPAAVLRHPEEWDMTEWSKTAIADKIESESMKRVRHGSAIALSLAMLGSVASAGFSCAASVYQKKGDDRRMWANGALAILGAGAAMFGTFGLDSVLDGHSAAIREANQYRNGSTKSYKVWNRVMRGK